MTTEPLDEWTSLDAHIIGRHIGSDGTPVYGVEISDHLIAYYTEAELNDAGGTLPPSLRTVTVTLREDDARYWSEAAAPAHMVPTRQGTRLQKACTAALEAQQ